MLDATPSSPAPSAPGSFAPAPPDAGDRLAVALQTLLDLRADLVHTHDAIEASIARLSAVVGLPRDLDGIAVPAEWVGSPDLA